MTIESLLNKYTEALRVRGFGTAASTMALALLLTEVRKADAEVARLTARLAETERLGWDMRDALMVQVQHTNLCVRSKWLTDDLSPPGMCVACDSMAEFVVYVPPPSLGVTTK